MLFDLAALRRRSPEDIPVIVEGRETCPKVVGNHVGPLRDATLLKSPSNWRDLTELHVQRRDNPLGRVAMDSGLRSRESLRRLIPQVAKRPCVFIPHQTAAAMAAVHWLRQLGAVAPPRTANGVALADLLGQIDEVTELPSEAEDIAARFQMLAKTDHERRLDRLNIESSIIAASRAFLQEMAPADYLVLCAVGPGEEPRGWLAANYAGALGEPLLPLGPEVLLGADGLIAAGEAVFAGPVDADRARHSALAQKARRTPERATLPLNDAIRTIETLNPRFVGFVSASSGFPLELEGSPPLAARFALGHLAGPDLLSTSLLIARAALSEDVARPSVLSVFLADAADVPGEQYLKGAVAEVVRLAAMLREVGALHLVPEAPAFVAGLDDVAVVREAVQQGRGHFGILRKRSAIRQRQDRW